MSYIEIQKSHIWDGCKTDMNPNSRFYKTIAQAQTFEKALRDLVTIINDPENPIQDGNSHFRIKCGDQIFLPTKNNVQA